MPEQKLKPCPFCGGEARLSQLNPENTEDGMFVKCKRCNSSSTMMFPIMDSVEDDLIQRWNTRPKSECIEFNGSRNGKGYGKLSFNGKSFQAHRVSYRLFKGKIPDGMFVCHTCDNPSCINPEHLFAGTQSDNMRDCVQKGRCYNPKGESHPCSKITDEQASEIKGSDLSERKLAEKYGISRRNIRDIRKGTAWNHI